MRRCLWLFTILLCKFNLLFAQGQFILSGKTNTVTNGKVILSLNALKDFYTSKIKQDTVIVHNHLFTFKGTIQRPECVRLRIISSNNKSFLTEPFFVDTGFQQMLINSNQPMHDPSDVGIGITIKGSKASDEYFKTYIPLFANISKQYDAYFKEKEECYTTTDPLKRKALAKRLEPDHQIIREREGLIVLNYAKGNPKSPIIPWTLYSDIHYKGYNEYYLKVLEITALYMPVDMRNVLRVNLANAKINTVGNQFLLTDFIKANIPKNINENKYTLVDFWFSGCGPCIAQFEQLKGIYNKYNKKGFEIVAVSVDRKEAMPAYQKILKEKNYPWQQILDLGGEKTKSLNISSFPTSFLLDSQGKIVKTRIDPTILTIFLDGNL